MKTVVFIITKSEIGGAQSWVCEQAKNLQGECRVVLITSDYGWLTKQPYFSEIKIVPGLLSACNLLALISVINILKVCAADSVIASSANAGLYTRLARCFYRFKCVYVSHGWSCLYNGGRFKKVFCSIEKYLSYLTDVIWCISKSDEIKAIDGIGIKKDKIVTLVNSITPIKDKSSPDFNWRVLFVGRLTHPKRPDLIAEVILEDTRFKLDVVGDGDMLPFLIERYKNTDNISFLGAIDSFSDFYKYDIFVLLSESEGLPMSAIEACTAGLPMILSDVGGCFEIIDGNNGVLINNDKDELKSALDLISEQYSFFYGAAREQKHKFDINKFRNKYKSIIL